MQGILFRAHQCNRLFSRKLHNSNQSRDEVLRFAPQKIIHKAVRLINSRVGRPSAQGFAEKFIRKASIS